MSGRPWYKRYPSDFMQATMALSVEQKGAYGVALDLMYDHGGPIEDDARWLSRVCGCTMQRWRKLRAELIALGKLTITAEGKLSNGRMIRELLKQRDDHAEKRENGRRGGLRTQAKKHPKNPSKPNDINGRDAHPLDASDARNDPESETCGVFDYLLKENKYLDDDWLDDTAPDAPPHTVQCENENMGRNTSGFSPKTCAVFEPESNEINDIGSSKNQAYSETQIVESLVPPESSTNRNPSLTHPTNARDRACGRDARPIEPDEFSQWYAAYPRKRGRGQARRAYATAIRKIAPNALLAVTLAYPFDLSRPDFIPHPATWLNGERWLDQPDPIAKRTVPAFDPSKLTGAGALLYKLHLENEAAGGGGSLQAMMGEIVHG